jgi:uncharacterized membrane protein
MTLLISFLLALGAAVVAITVFMTVSNYSSLPDRIPTHFGFSPEPDGYGPKFMAWMLPVVQLFVFAIEGFAYGQQDRLTRAAIPAMLIADAVAITLLTSQWLIIETAKHGASSNRYRTFWFVFALTMFVVPVSMALGK